jgi:hypothetical protein
MAGQGLSALSASASGAIIAGARAGLFMIAEASFIPTHQNDDVPPRA